MTYEAAYDELREITEEIEQEDVPVAVLAEKVRRASELIAFCQARLRSTEAEVNHIIRQLGEGPAEG